jgi:putative hydrolases of HD superfamily
VSSDRLDAQLRFVLEIDRLKGVDRRNHLADGTRVENVAEHSWHLALLALVLGEHSAEPVDLGRVVRMLLVHDLVEIDAGDTFVYDDAGRASKAAREQAAADRIFSLLPADQATELRSLWDEFEALETPEARYARSIDRLAPVVLNHASGGLTWAQHGITADRVREVNSVIADGAPALWEAAAGLIDDAVDQGMLPDP